MKKLAICLSALGGAIAFGPKVYVYFFPPEDIFSRGAMAVQGGILLWTGLPILATGIALGGSYAWRIRRELKNSFLEGALIGGDIARRLGY